MKQYIRDNTQCQRGTVYTGLFTGIQVKSSMLLTVVSAVNVNSQ